MQTRVLPGTRDDITCCRVDCDIANACPHVYFRLRFPDRTSEGICCQAIKVYAPRKDFKKCVRKSAKRTNTKTPDLSWLSDSENCRNDLDTRDEAYKCLGGT